MKAFIAYGLLVVFVPIDLVASLIVFVLSLPAGLFLGVLDRTRLRPSRNVTLLLFKLQETLDGVASVAIAIVVFHLLGVKVTVVIPIILGFSKSVLYYFNPRYGQQFIYMPYFVGGLVVGWITYISIIPAP